MTIRLGPPYPYYHPLEGWVNNGNRLTAEQAEKSCKKHRIPFAKVDENTPDYWYTVLETTVAGTYFIDDYELLASELKEGDILHMQREDNPHDSYAVLLKTPKWDKIGYLPKKSNETIARLMDLYESFRCVITGLSKDRTEISIKVQILRGKMVKRHFSVSFDVMAGYLVTIDPVPVRRKTCKFIPLPEQVHSMKFCRKLSEEDRWNLSWGHRSWSMDDRWNFFAQGNLLYISRSWTGHCIYVVELGPGDEHIVTVEGDSSSDKDDDRYSLSILGELFDHWLAPVELPRNRVPPSIYGNVKVLPGPESEGFSSINWDGTIYL